MQKTSPSPGSTGNAPGGGTCIAVDGVSFSYGDKLALDGMCLHVREGERHGLIGPNGAGKSTLINLVVGTIALPAGERGKVSVLGSAAGDKGTRTSLGYVPQGNALFPSLTGLENMLLFARMQGLSGREARARSLVLLARLGLSQAAGRAVEGYSEGMKKRLNLGVGLVHRPRLLVLDEPTAGVDPQSREHILGLLGELAGSEGVTLLLSTHLLEEPERLCERISIVDHGKRVTVESPAECGADGSGSWLRGRFFALTGYAFREEAQA